MTLPVAQPLNLSGDEDTEILATLVGSDPDLDPLDNFEIVSGPANGVVEPVGDGGIEEYVYKPNANFNGTDSFTYRVIANGEPSETVTVDIIVNATADVPVVTQALGPAPGLVEGPLGGGDKVDVAVSLGGDWMEVRHGYNQLGETDGIYFQLISYQGAPLTNGLVNSTTTDVQFDPAVAALNNGSYVITWTSLNQDGDGAGVYLQKYLANGSASGGETLVNTTTTGDQMSADVAKTNDNGFRVVWQSYDGVETHILSQKYDSMGGAQGGEDTIDSAVGYDAFDPSIATLNNGSQVITWTTPGGLDGSETGVFAQMISNQGNPVGGQFQVNVTTADAQGNSEVVALAGGGFVVGYTTGPLGIATGVSLVRFAPNGTQVGGEIVLPITNGDVPNFSIAALPDGGFVVGWENVITGNSNIWLQRFDSAGIALNQPVPVDTGSSDEQTAPSLAVAMGDLLAVYSEDPVLAGDNVVKHQFFNLPTKVDVLNEGAETVAYELLPMVDILDPDSAQLTSLTVQIKGGYRDGDTLDVSSAETGLNESFVGDTLTLTGAGILSNYAGVLSSLRMKVADGGTGDRMLEIIATAADGSSVAEQLVLKVNTANQGVTGTSGAETLRGGNGMDTLQGGNGDDYLTGNDNNDLLRGESGNDYIWGGDGHDTLNGGEGADTMEGYYGDDTYVVNSLGDVVTESEANGNDTVRTLLSYTLTANVENLELGGINNIDGTGTGTDNRLLGNAGDNSLFGGTGNDTLIGRDGNDILDGGAGNDTLSGNEGDDTYFTDGSDTLIEHAGNGFDLVFTDQNWILAANFEDLELTGVADINGSGNGEGNYLVGNSGNNLLNGVGGNDFLFGGGGNDSLYGGSGIDAMSGELGDDTYVVDNIFDTVTEAASEGIDTVRANVDFTLTAHVEHLLFMGESNFTGNGNNLSNRITGSGNNDNLYGLGGYDTLTGNTGSDYLDGGDLQDLLNGGAGFDTLLGGTGNDILYGGADADTLYGENGNDTIHGGSGIDSILGGGGSDSILSGIGDDTVYGGDGNDFIDDVSGTGSANVAFYGDAGNDTIYGTSGACYVDGGDGNDSIIGAGNGTLHGGNNDDYMEVWYQDASTSNYFQGDAGNDTLIGLDGNDTLLGGDDNDSLTGGNGGDALDAGNGMDTLNGGSGNDYLYGQADADLLDAGIGDDSLYGGGGNDTMIGGAGFDNFVGGDGDDVYVIGSDMSDTIVENTAEGIDTIDMTGNGGYTLSDVNVENLIARANDFDMMSLYGHSGDNLIDGVVMSGSAVFTLIGGDGNDTLDGDSGVDQLYGGNGNDVLVGGGGNDVFTFDSPLNDLTNVDSVDFESGADTLQLYDTTFTSLAGGYLSASQFVIGAAAADGDDMIIFDDTTGALYYDADADGVGAQVQFAQFTGTWTLSNSDIYVYLVA